MKMASNISEVPHVESAAVKADTAIEEKGLFLHHLWASVAATAALGVICCAVYPAIVYGVAQAVFPNQANGSLVKRDGTPTVKDDEAVGSALLGQNFSQPGYFHPRPSAAGAGYDASSSGGSNLGPLSDKLINGMTTAQPAVAPATQPTESLSFDGLRLRAIHYAVENNIAFKLYKVSPDGTKTEVPLRQYQDAQGNLNDIALVDAFPHPTTDDDAKRTVMVADDFAQPIPADAVTASGSGLDPHISLANAEIQKARIAAARKISADQVETLIQQHTDRPSLGIFGEPGVNVLMLNLALDAKYPLPSTK